MEDMLYTLYYESQVIDTGMNYEEFIQELEDFNLDWSYYPDGYCIAINNPHYWYDSYPKFYMSSYPNVVIGKEVDYD